VPAGQRIWFSGGIRGTAAYVMYLPNGNSFALIANSDADGLLEAMGSESIARLGALPANTLNLAATPAYTDAPANMPVIRSQEGVVQGASFQRGITPGSWFSIIGWRLANTTRLWAESDFTQGDALPTRIDGVEVRVNGVPAAVYYVSPTQINAQVPAHHDPRHGHRAGLPGRDPEPPRTRGDPPQLA
jgi:hypothetical protein